MLDAYLAFATEVNQAIELADDPEDLDWQRIIKATVVEPMPIYCYAGVQEWIVEGIRWRSLHAYTHDLGCVLLASRAGVLADAFTPTFDDVQDCVC